MIPRLVAALIVSLAAGGIVPSFGFVVNPIRHHGQGPVTKTRTLHRHHYHHPASSSTVALNLVPSFDAAQDRIIEQFTAASSSPFFFLLADDDSGVASWRQYVPLAVIGLVLLDILLGSPAANSLLAPLKQPDPDAKPKSKETYADSWTEDDNNNNTRNVRKERIDTDQVARAAINKARNTLELKRYLEENKTDWQKMNDIKKKLDAEMESLDEELEERGKDLEERSKRLK